MEIAQNVENQDYLVTYKFYDERARRLGIFARKVGDMMHIVVVTCSNKDNFTKKKARMIFEGRERKGHIKGREEFVELGEDKFKWAFIKWCKENYFKPITATFTYSGKILSKDIKGEDSLPVVIGGLKLMNVEVEPPTIQLKSLLTKETLHKVTQHD